MGGRASLTAPWLALAVSLTAALVHADDDRVVVPTCEGGTGSALDVSLLRSLLELEVSEPSSVTRIEVGEGVCTGAPVEVRIALGGDEARCTIAFPVEPDARVAARVLALAIAERTRARARTDHVTEGDAGASPIERPTESAPVATEALATRPEEDPSIGEAAPSIPPTVGVALAGRLAGRFGPASTSWLVGLRGDVGGSFDRFWGLRAEVLALWSHGEAERVSADASVLAAATALALSPARGPGWDFSIAVRMELGAILFFGPFGLFQAQPWLVIGGHIGATGEVSDGVALTADLGASWSALGGQYGPTGPVLIDLTVLTFDVSVGMRFAI